jgi:beta-fructofuranosidase
MYRSRRDFLQAMGAMALGSSYLGSRASFLDSFQKSDDEVLAARLASDPLRPQFHLLPAKGWMNDPNGPIYWKGSYHMFFQYNPNAAVWGDMHWAHAVSKDMIHWQNLPIALAPTPGWDDTDGCFTGSAVDDRGTATILYTGVKKATPERATLRDGVSNLREVQCLATSADPELRTWTKSRQPVLQPPEDPRLTGFRDPFLWRDPDWWYLGVASGLRKEGGRVLLYRSKNLRVWEYLHPLATGKWNEKELTNPVDSGEMWECPDFFALGSKHVLLYSTAGQVLWESGELDTKELVFHSEKRGWLDHGAYYAQKTQLDAKGNRILWGWIPETRPEKEFSAAGWAGCMALPRILSLNGDSELEMRVAPEAQSLRTKALVPQHPATPAQRAASIRAARITNLAGEMRWSTAASSHSLALHDDAGPWLSLRLTLQDSAARLAINDSSLELPAPGSAHHEFHVILDASVAEVFCDHQHVVTKRIYRKPEGPLKIVLAEQDLERLDSLEAWQLKPISADRLTT